MVEVTFGTRTVDLPYMIQIPDVTEELFDELTDEDTKAELFDGVMIVHSPATLRHDAVANFVRALLTDFAKEKGRGGVFGPDGLVRLRPGRRFAPDGFYVRADRLPDPTPREFEGAPDLVLEVLSPSNRAHDLNTKRPAYREAGVREIWLVDPDAEEVVVDRRRGAGYATKTYRRGRVASQALGGFWLDAAWMWADPLPSAYRCLRQLLEGRP